MYPTDKEIRRDKRRRPKKFCQAIVEEFTKRLISGESMRSICKLAHMPSEETICQWLKKHREFQQEYVIARELQAEFYFDEIQEIADNASNDWMQNNDPDNPGWIANRDHIARSSLRVTALKWRLARMNLRKYGDRAQIEHRFPPDSDAAKQLDEGLT